MDRIRFLTSSPDHQAAPKPELPEYAFAGRSNVGKSSLINALTGRKNLAHTSGTPGKTQLINHFLVDEAWYLVDLPGYGYAKVSKAKRRNFRDLIEGYLQSRPNLITTFLLVDSNVPAQASDLGLMRALGEAGLPFAIVFTKADKLSNNKLQTALAAYRKTLAADWDELPPSFITSAEKSSGLEDIRQYIGTLNRELGFRLAGQPPKS